MKKIIFVLLVLVSGFSFSTKSQCPELLKNNNINHLLKPFNFDGLFNCETLTKGEGVVMYKTFFEGLRYRLKVISSGANDKFIIEIFDLKNNLLFSNKNDKSTRMWDFTPESSIQVVVFITLSESDEKSSNVALVSGFKEVINE